MARKVKKGKRLQEVLEQNLITADASHGGPTDTPKSSSRKKKAAKEVAGPSGAPADAVAEPQERRSRRRRNVEEIPKGSPISPRRTRRTKERKMHPHSPAAGVQINFYLSPGHTVQDPGTVAGIHVTGFPASIARELALGTPVAGKATLPVHTGVDNSERPPTPAPSPQRRDESIGKAVNNLV